MAEKSKLHDGIMLRRGLSKFDTTLLSTDGGKYSPSIRRLRQNYLHDTKCFASKIFLSPIPSLSMTKHLSKRIRDPQLSALQHHPSSTESSVTPLKCDHCQKNEGLFQCCHCNQHLCIQCCNKHYKKVTAECEHLHELSNLLLAKIICKKNDLEKQKQEAIEQCHKWRIDTINTINAAHKIVIQAIYDEYETLNKEYELFIKKEMSYINIDEHELIEIQKRKPSSLLVPSSSSIETKNSIKSIDTIKSHIETLMKYIDDTGILSLKVKLPKFDINNHLGIESHFGDQIRFINASSHNDDYNNDASLTESKEMSKQELSTDSQSILNNTNDSLHSSSIEEFLSVQSDHYTIASNLSSSSLEQSFHDEYSKYSLISSANQLNKFDNTYPNTYLFQHISPCSMQTINDTNGEHTNQNVSMKYEHDDSPSENINTQLETPNEVIEQSITSMQTCDLQQTMTTIPYEASSVSTVDSPSNNYLWNYYQTHSNVPSIQ